MSRQVRQQLKGAFPHCQWCGGYGCMCCDEERRKHEERRSQPIFTADRSDPADMEALRRVAGREALERAFGPGGGASTRWNTTLPSNHWSRRCERHGHPTAGLTVRSSRINATFGPCGEKGKEAT